MKKVTKNVKKETKVGFSIKGDYKMDEASRALFGLGNMVNGAQLFYVVNKEYPNSIGFSDIDKKLLYDAVMKEYKLDEKDIILSKFIFKDEKRNRTVVAVMPIKKNLWVVFSISPFVGDCLEIFYDNKTDKKEVDALCKLLKKYYKKEDVSGKIFILQVDKEGDEELEPYDLIEVTTEIKKHYNDDFAEVNEKIVARLNKENDKGLVLLHGISGTGKTSYIRYLTTKVSKKLIFLSPDLASRISSPDFMKILSNYPNSVIVIEDAETIVESRKGGGNSAMSNLLNLTDGLLADCLKIQIICSFNTDVSHIDQSLLRKGRLIAKYEFKELEKSKAQKLTKSLGYKTKIEVDMTLADIFNQEEKEFKGEEGKKIGFKMGK